MINTGSSSIKFAVFAHSATPNEQRRFYCGEVDRIGGQSRLVIINTDDAGQETNNSTEYSVQASNHAQALQIILDRLDKDASAFTLVAAGHRVVHGGTAFSQAVYVDNNVLEKLQSFIALAPAHQPHALQAIESLMAQYPNLPQVACFDTAFHTTMPSHEQRFALPVSLMQQGIRRYGFHGLSYEYITSVLPVHLGELADGKVVIAHLGHGVSMCAVNNRQSIATTMSFTPLDGLPMGTRSGAIDPAIILYLLEQGIAIREISDLLYHQSGLLGLSGMSGDMRTLLSSDDPDANEAVTYFCYRVNRELGSLTAALGGLDAVVFTGGIGENAVEIRERICQMAAWLGLAIDTQANQEHALRISMDHSRIAVWVIPTDEEKVIAQNTAAILLGGQTKPASYIYGPGGY